MRLRLGRPRARAERVAIVPGLDRGQRALVAFTVRS